MANKMLIDATHPEETRVVVLRGNRVEEFDFESAHRKQLRGNIYLAKVTRVEPSLQAAFVDYGGNRHGFLAFSEIHPDYYQIPIADRQALIDEEERAQRAADDEVDRRSRRHRDRERISAARREDEVVRSEMMEPAAEESAPAQPEPDGAVEESVASEPSDTETPSAGQALAAELDDTSSAGFKPAEPQPIAEFEPIAELEETHVAEPVAPEPQAEPGESAPADEVTAVATDLPSPSELGRASDQASEVVANATDGNDEALARHDEDGGDVSADDEAEVVESVGGADALEEVPDRAPRYRRQYKIQEVIKRRQVMLVQVVKEERGTKGAALTTYLSLAGRYSVLMPNTARGGGISRKITNPEDRARLKEVAQELEVPDGMGVILRTAGANRTKTEIKRDFEYLLRLWETVRDLTLKSTAPKLVYEEGSLVKRSIRDLYTKDIEEVLVAGSDSYQEAKDFMRMLMPTHAKNVKLYSDTQPLLSRYGVENQLDAMFSPVVQLRSGGYIVLNQAEALVAIDVNSGRATREHHIEDTALKTNMEAADEIARQLRLRDLAGLIVIDFIDMDEKRNNRAVERRLKECLKHDRARIQVGRISHFGLLEMSRQRIRTSVLESSTEKCPYCGGSGHVRSVSSLALQVLRTLEEQLMRSATHNLIARTRPDVALYVLNQKRAHLRALEERFAITIMISADETVRAPQAFVIDRGEQVHTLEAARAIAEQNQVLAAVPLEEEDDLEEADSAAEDGDADESEDAAPSAAPEHGEGRSRRRRRRRRRGGREVGESPRHEEQPTLHENGALDGFGATEDAAATVGEEIEPPHGELLAASDDLEADERSEPHRADVERRRRRRGRRGGRRNRHERNGDTDQYERAFSGPQQHGHSHGEGFASSTAAETELSAAVPDLDSSPAEPSAMPEPPAPSEAVAAPPPPDTPMPASEPEPPRRRSTVRERAPTLGNAESSFMAAPAPAPVESAPKPVVTEINEDGDSNQPRRTGWWSRRLAGS